MAASGCIPQVLCLKAETYPRKVKTPPQADAFRDCGVMQHALHPKGETCATTSRDLYKAQHTGHSNIHPNLPSSRCSIQTPSGCTGTSPLKGGTCTVTHEEGYETAEKKIVHDLKREASRMEEVMTILSTHYVVK